jgi:hypothetical protein
MVIAERTTSYGFLAALSVKPVAIAQQGRTDLGPKILFYYHSKKLKLRIQNATLIHAWGPVMTFLAKANVDMNKV